MQGEENNMRIEGYLLLKYQNFQFCEHSVICLNRSTRCSLRYIAKNGGTPVAHLILLLLPLFFRHHRHPSYPKGKDFH